MRLPCVMVLVLSLMAGSSRADDPRAAPMEHKVVSNNRRFLVVSDPKRDRTTVFPARPAPRGKPSWQMSGYFPVMALSDDGQCLTAIHPGGNLLDLTYRPDDIVLTFYYRGRLVRSIRVSDVIPDKADLIRTESHYQWAVSFAFASKHRFELEAANGKRFAFDAATGVSIGPTQVKR